MVSQILLERKQGKDGKFHYLALTPDRKRGYYVYDSGSIEKFCSFTSSLDLWGIHSEDPWETFNNSHHRTGMEPETPEFIMTSSYEEVCNYLKVNVLIGIVE